MFRQYSALKVYKRGQNTQKSTKTIITNGYFVKVKTTTSYID